MARRRLDIPIFMILFLVATFTGAYFIRKGILRKHMENAIETLDEGSLIYLLDTWPSQRGTLRELVGMNPLHWAASAGCPEVAEWLLERGAAVDELAAVGGLLAGSETPLCCAAEEGHTEVARVLIAHGADVNAATEGGVLAGVTALDYALLGGHPAMVRLLLDSGVKLKGGPDFLYRRLDAALEKCGEDLAAMILTRTGDVDMVDERGWTALFHAVSDDRLATAEFLIRKGADVNRRDRAGDTPLHLAVKRRICSMAELLLSHGADVHARDKDGRTPLRIVRETYHPDMADILREHGAKE